MKIGVIADTHIPDRAKGLPPKVLEAFKKVDMVIHAGDLVEACVLDELKSVCKDVRGVWGNMDPYEIRKELPEKAVIVIGGHKIGVMHGYGNPASLIDILKEAFAKDKVDMVIFGHSHSATNEKKDGIIYFNPGSPTDKIFAAQNSYGIIEINDKITSKIVKI